MFYCICPYALVCMSLCVSAYVLMLLCIHPYAGVVWDSENEEWVDSTGASEVSVTPTVCEYTKLGTN